MRILTVKGNCLGAVRFETDLNQVIVNAPAGELPSRTPGSRRNTPRFAVLVRGTYESEECWHPVTGVGLLKTLAETRTYTPEGRTV